MKPAQFSKLLIQFANLQADLGGISAADKTREIAAIFARSKSASVAASLDTAYPWMERTKRPKIFEKNVAEYLPPFASFTDFLAVVATPAKTRPIKALLKFLTEHQEMEWSAFTKQLNTALSATDEDIIDFYVERLTETYEDEVAFKPVFASLKTDKRVKIAQALKIATQFTGFTVKGTKANAFDWIWKRHHYYITGLASAKAMHGKSAA